MKRFLESRIWPVAALLSVVLAVSGLAAGGTRYVVANDDQSGFILGSITFYTISPAGLLTHPQAVVVSSVGISGGFFGTNRISAINSGKNGCVYASEAGTGDIVGIVASTLAPGGSALGSATDGGSSNGIGLAGNDQYLYASFTDSNTIGTFAVTAGCGITFLNDTAVSGLNGGIINSMAVHGKMLVATYTDGSIESFDISSGTPVPNGDEQLSTATVRSQDSSYPNSIDITSDGRFAIFGDTSTAMVVEVSQITAGKLGKTVVYKSTASISSSNVMLSPDESLLYVANTQGDAVSALFFNKNTGKLSAGCTSGPLKGQSSRWSYLAGLALIGDTGNGGGVYVAEFGGPSSIGIVHLSASGQTCTLQEDAKSPVSDPRSPGLLSIGNFPPRSF
jgi:6-phosphogluconolactonase (cycloisomerase 2 family)